MANHEVPELLARWGGGDKDVLDRLLPMVYSELHRMAAGYLRRERVDHTLQPTALINEAYSRLVGSSNVSWESRAHFFSIAARVTRRILVDHARQHQADKRGAGFQKVTSDAANESGSQPEDVDLCHAALKSRKMDFGVLVLHSNHGQSGWERTPHRTSLSGWCA